jgi:4-alpha-glucanotransferase
MRVLGAMLEEISHGSIDAPRAIAEDLGVIPPFVRDGLREIGMPGYRVIPWERDGSRYRDPRAFPKASVSSWSTHDTSPIDAWWTDFSAADRKDLAERAHVPVDADDEGRSRALLNYLYRSNSDLALVLVQELLGLRDRINTPGTVGPENWSFRLPRPIEDIESDPRVNARFDAIRSIVRSAGR